jgi:hypothetical protein
MVTIVLETTLKLQDGYVLIPRSSDSIKTRARAYYNRYLQEAIDQPEFDGKQLITFQKVSYQEALDLIAINLWPIDAKIKAELEGISY